MKPWIAGLVGAVVGLGIGLLLPLQWYVHQNDEQMTVLHRLSGQARFINTWTGDVVAYNAYYGQPKPFTVVREAPR